MKFADILCVSVLGSFGVPATCCAQVIPGVVVETVVSGLDQASAMAFAPDGRLFVVERGSASVRVVEDGVLGGVWATTAASPAVGEGGLLGIAIDPDFMSNRFVYVYYTRAVGGRVEGVVERWVEQAGVGAVPTRVGPTMTTQARHCGGAMVFDRSGALTLVVGDGSLDPLAQSLAHASGKVLRMRVPDGSPPSDNPWFGVQGAAQHIWAYGIRNAFGLAIHPVTGDLYETENGGSGGDELNRIVRGGNYGWPIYDGVEPAPDPVCVDPLWTRSRPDPALTGAAFTTSPFLPSALRGRLFATSFNLGGLHAFEIDGTTGSVLGTATYGIGNTSFGVLDGPDGALWVLDDPAPQARGASRVQRIVAASLPRPALHVTAVSNVGVGGSVTFGVTANPGDAAVIWVAGRQLPAPLPTPFGGDLAVPIDLVLPALTIGNDVRGWLGLAIADDASLRGQTLHAQVATLTGGQTITLGNAASIVLH